MHDADHPSQLLLSTAPDRPAPPASPGAPGGAAVRGRCRARKTFTVRVRRGLRRVRAQVAGRRARVVKRHGRQVVVVRPRRGARSVTVRIRGVDRRGRRVTIKRRYRFCR
jgi:hypothetical protein